MKKFDVFLRPNDRERSKVYLSSEVDPAMTEKDEKFHAYRKEYADIVDKRNEEIAALRLEISHLVTEHESRCDAASKCIAELKAMWDGVQQMSACTVETVNKAEEIAALKADRDLWKDRAVVVAAHLDYEVLCGDIQQWVKQFRTNNQRQAEEIKRLNGLLAEFVYVESHGEDALKTKTEV